MKTSELSAHGSRKKRRTDGKEIEIQKKWPRDFLVKSHEPKPDCTRTRQRLPGHLEHRSSSKKICVVHAGDS